MADEGSKTDKQTLWLMGIISGLILVVAAWYLYANDAKFDRISNAMDRVLKVQSEGTATQARMQSDIEWIKRGIVDIYTEDDAEKAHADIKRTTDDLYGKYRNIDERLSTIEKQERSR